MSRDVETGALRLSYVDLDSESGVEMAVLDAVTFFRDPLGRPAPAAFLMGIGALSGGSEITSQIIGSFSLLSTLSLS